MRFPGLGHRIGWDRGWVTGNASMRVWEDDVGAVSLFLCVSACAGALEVAAVVSGGALSKAIGAASMMLAPGE